MPQIEVDLRYQTATLWVFYNRDRYGETVTYEPIEINVRWEDLRRANRQKETLASGGKLVEFFDALVIADRHIPLHSIMYLGSEEDWLGTGTFGQASELFEVIEYDRIPDIKNRIIRREYKLKRYKDNLPATTGTNPPSPDRAS